MSWGLSSEACREQRPVLEDLADGERGQQDGDVGGATDRPVGDALHEQADDDRRHDDDRQAHEQRQPGADAEDRDVGCDHHQVAVGEVDEAEDSEDHRQAHRHERVETARAQRVDDLLDRVVRHDVTPSTATPPTPR